jgi:diaminohydroxyphosphoribosylaminopyrimidine deaminase / 5-amino-6-(5-phosphoribosylamino)uracil reductase
VQPADPEQGKCPGDPGEPEADRHWLRAAIELSFRCPPSDSAFSVGAVLVEGAATVLGTGFSRQSDDKDHAEEVALRRAEGANLAEATLYSSLEPCVRRASRLATCAELTFRAGVRRVVIAWLEPPLFVPGGGAAWLSARGVTVVEYPDMAAAARVANQHLLSGRARADRDRSVPRLQT